MTTVFGWFFSADFFGISVDEDADGTVSGFALSDFTALFEVEFDGFWLIDDIDDTDSVLFRFDWTELTRW